MLRWAKEDRLSLRMFGVVFDAKICKEGSQVLTDGGFAVLEKKKTESALPPEF